MEIIMLGTGTSQGIPVIGCRCEVCSSHALHDKRLRSSAIVRMENGLHLQIDCGPDFRQQMLTERVDHLEHILITHEHMDHIAGLDDVRAFNFGKGLDMNVYVTRRVEERLRHQFDYAFADKAYPGAPRIKLHRIAEPFEIEGVRITPIPVWHGKWPVFGYRIGNMAYVTDVNRVPESSFELMKGLDVLVLGVLHRDHHHSHFHLEEGLEVAKRIDAKRTVFTHISHRMGKHADVSVELPTGIELAYDGLKLPFSR